MRLARSSVPLAAVRARAATGRGTWTIGVLAVALGGCGGSSTAGSSSAGQLATGKSSALEQQFVRVVKQIQPEVVQIRTPTGLGSGVVLDAGGDIVTNAHVVGDSREFLVTLADGGRYGAKLVGAYVPEDLAVIAIRPARRLTAARFADSAKVEVGDIVLAAGNPLGLQSSVTDGIVSALGRSVTESRGVVLPNVIQTSAPINPGNSGGALVDLGGEVIGIPTIAAANPQFGTAAAGIGFAIPSNRVIDIAGQIVTHGRVVNSRRAALGITFADNVARSGALVAAVESGGPAAQAGIVVGDSIEAIADSVVPDAEGLATVLAALRPGQSVQVSITRADGASATLSVRLGQLPGG
jgi:putative serine protease PepD